jgi:hypothetical protein
MNGVNGLWRSNNAARQCGDQIRLDVGHGACGGPEDLQAVCSRSWMDVRCDAHDDCNVGCMLARAVVECSTSSEIKGTSTDKELNWASLVGVLVGVNHVQLHEYSFKRREWCQSTRTCNISRVFTLISNSGCLFRLVSLLAILLCSKCPVSSRSHVYEWRPPLRGNT